MAATPFQTEAWTEYSIGVLILLLRYFARWKAVGFKGWQGDDYLAVLALTFWDANESGPMQAELVMLEPIGQNGTNIGVTNEIGAKLSGGQLERLEFGSKCPLAGWNFYVTLIWCLKGCILCFYHHMALGLKQQKVVKWTQVTTILAYVAAICVIWGHCTPVQKNWQVYPYPGDKCTLAVANYVTLVVLNISTDLAIVCIPLLLLWKVKLNIQRKLMIGLLLCSGVFIMIAALLLCALSLRDIQGINFVGIIAVNAAAIKPLFSATRWLISSKGSGKDKSSGYPNKYGYPLGTMGHSGIRQSLTVSRHHKGMTELGDNSSEEHIVQKAEYHHTFKADIRAATTTSEQSSHQDGIMVTKAYKFGLSKLPLDVQSAV